MGYYTYFSLDVENDEGKKIEIAKELWNRIFGSDEEMTVVRYEGKRYVRKHPCSDDDIDYNNLLFTEDMKWYECDDDMLEVSLLFPDCIFHLHGSGEDDDDLWTSHYCNGKRQFCRAVIPPYDPDLMEQVLRPKNIEPVGIDAMV